MPIEPSLPDSDPVSETVAADQVAAHATDPHGHHGPIHTHCENCGTALQGPFCHKCGQHDFEFHRSFGHVFLEALENFLHFDAKFFRNIVTLLFRPGQLSADFNGGKRASQMPPLRLYLFTAFIFFLLFFAGSGKKFEGLEIGEGPHTKTGFSINERPPALGEAIEAITDSREKSLTTSQHSPAKNSTQDSSASNHPDVANRPHISVKPIEKSDREKSDFERFLEHQGERSLDPEFRRELGHAFVASFPKLLLICMPLFALITRVLFLGSRQVYLQHLVVAIHFHTFIYLWMMFRDGWVFLGSFVHVGGIIAFAANLWLFVYPLLMLRRLYGNSWLKTGLKTFTLATAYTCVIAIAFFFTAVVLFFLL